MKDNNKHLVVFLVGGSGTGKTTVAKKLVEDGIYDKAITCTTRQKREGEKHLVDYIFTTKENLFKMYKNNELIESPTEFSGNWYGCPLKSVYGNKTKPVVAIIEYEGLSKALDSLKNEKDLIIAPVFLEPLSEKIVIEGMRERGSNEKEISERIKERKTEESWGNNPNYVLKIKRDLSLSKEDSINATANKIANLIDKYFPTQKETKSSSIKFKK